MRLSSPHGAFLAISMLLPVVPSIAWAQSSSLSGKVIDASDAIVRDVSLTLTDDATGQSWQGRTNGEGVYTFALIRTGMYRLKAKADGFKALDRTGILVSTGQNAVLNLTLEVGDTTQSLTVAAEDLQVNTVDASVSTLIDRQFVANIPLNGRTLQSLMTTVPGVNIVPSSGNGGYNGSITVNGQRTESNYFTVDGVSANVNTGTVANPPFGTGYGGATPGQTALGTTQSMVSLDALEEFRASTSTYSAEFGRTPGGQFAFTTRSGTNQYHGSLFHYFRNDVLDANDFFSNRLGLPRQAKRQNDFGGTLGGPVSVPGLYSGRDRTFVFVSYEGLRLRAPQVGTEVEVPSDSLRRAAPVALQPFLNTFPKPNGRDLGNGLALFASAYSNPSTMNATSVRMDHTFSSALKVFGRYSTVPSDAGSRIAANPANTITSAVAMNTATFGVTAVLNPRVTNDTRFNYTVTDSTQQYGMINFGGAVPLDLKPYPGFGLPNGFLRFGIDIGTSRALFILPRETRQNQHNVTTTWAANLGAHTLKLGIDYRQLSNQLGFPLFHLRPSFTSVDAVLNNRPQAFAVIRSLAASIRPRYTNFSTFAQDEWRVGRRLTISAGLRWDVNPAPSDGDGRLPFTITSTDVSALQAAPQGTPLWSTYYRGFAPRLGAAYQVRPQQAGWVTVLRAGVGLFYDLGTAEASAGYAGLGATTQANFANVPFPPTQQLLDAVALPSTNAPYTSAIYGFDPSLRLPKTWQWNVTLEQGLGNGQSLSVGYLGSAGRGLLATRSYQPALLGNRNFLNNGQVLITSNGASSDYHALQAQYQRRMTRGLQVLGSYTWSHAIDDATSNFTLTKLLRASADFDIRQNAQMALSYNLPAVNAKGLAGVLFRDWGFEGRLSARSALPVDVITATLVDAATGQSIAFQPNVVPGQSLYVNEKNAPGGRRINFAAFTAAPAGVQGNAGRNLARGFSSAQFDLTVRRELRLREGLRLQLRGEAYNVLNEAIMGGIENRLALGQSRFGYATNTQNNQLGGLSSLFQSGGPRSIQFSLKLLF